MDAVTGRLAQSVGLRRGLLCVLVVGFGVVCLTSCVADPPPRIGTAVAGNGQATVTWQPPLAEPSPVTAYVVTPWVGFTRQTPVVFNSTATTQVVTGLTPGVTYTFTVVAINARGYESASSAMSNPVAPAQVRNVYGWGGNDFGQVGDGTTTNRLSPIRIGTDADWASMAAGGAYTVAAKTDGTLWAWGNNGAGQLGDGTTTDHPSPVQVGTDTDWASVSAGAYHTVAVKTDGTLWGWGYNNYGQLSVGGTPVLTPIQVEGDVDNFAAVSAGGQHTVAVTTDGTLWAWGLNSVGQLGNGTTTDGGGQIGTATDWAAVTAGSNHTLAIKTDGTLWAWGWDHWGQLGNGTTSPSFSLSPIEIGLGHQWISVSAGGYHTMALAAP